LDRDSLSSAILKQVRKEKRFIRVVAEEDHFIEGKASDRLSQRAEADGLAFGNARRSVRPIHEMRRFFMDRLYKIIQARTRDIIIFCSSASPLSPVFSCSGPWSSVFSAS
jgi:hypothetical protein